MSIQSGGRESAAKPRRHLLRLGTLDEQGLGSVLLSRHDTHPRYRDSSLGRDETAERLVGLPPNRGGVHRDLQPITVESAYALS